MADSRGLTSFSEIEQLGKDVASESAAYLRSAVSDADFLSQKPRPIMKQHQHGQSGIIKPAGLAQINHNAARGETLRTGDSF